MGTWATGGGRWEGVQVGFRLWNVGRAGGAEAGLCGDSGRRPRLANKTCQGSMPAGGGNQQVVEDRVWMKSAGADVADVYGKKRRAEVRVWGSTVGAEAGVSGKTR